MWPTAPFYIPYSPGMPNWWDLVWWVFQIGIMSLLLWLLSHIALGIDRDFVKIDPNQTNSHEEEDYE